MYTVEQYKTLDWDVKQSLRKEIQDAYNPKHSENSIKQLKAKYGSELVEYLVCEQLCVSCDEFSFGICPVTDEQCCEACIKQNTRDSQVEIPDWNSDSDSIRRFGEQLASLDDSEVAIYEDKFNSGEY